MAKNEGSGYLVLLVTGNTEPFVELCVGGAGRFDSLVSVHVSPFYLVSVHGHLST